MYFALPEFLLAFWLPRLIPVRLGRGVDSNLLECLGGLQSGCCSVFTVTPPFTDMPDQLGTFIVLLQMFFSDTDPGAIHCEHNESAEKVIRGIKWGKV